MLVRLLKPGDDVLHIEAVRLLNDGAEMSLERSTDLISEPTYVFVVALDDAGRVMGRIYGHVLHRYEQTDLLLYEVDVLEEHQRQGIGKAMLEFVKQLCKDRGFVEMWVLTEGGNLPARRLYETAGGTEEGSPTSMYVFYPTK